MPLLLALSVSGLAAALAAGLEHAPPAFADSFYTGMQESLAINQNGYEIPHGLCCASTSVRTRRCR